MIAEAIKKILEISQPQKQIVNGREYFDRKLLPVIDPMPQPLIINTLTGIVDYINEQNKDAENKFILHILNYDAVDITSHLTGSFLQRPIFIKAALKVSGFRFDQFIDLEHLIIGLQTEFVQSIDTSTILSIIGNIQDGIVKTHVDDGISQKTTIKTGAATIKEVDVPSPITLQPYRTFMEIEQPKSPFILRLKPGAETPRAALFEADGGNWQLEAIQRIKTWLNDKLPGIPIIA